MKKAKVIFHKILQDSQDLGSDNEHMVSRVFFTVEIDGSTTNNLHSDVQQVVGCNFETDPLEMYFPKGYEGLLSYRAFREAVESYYRSAFGSQGKEFKIQGGNNIRMRDNTVVSERVVEFEVDEANPAW